MTHPRERVTMTFEQWQALHEAMIHTQWAVITEAIARYTDGRQPSDLVTLGIVASKGARQGAAMIREIPKSYEYVCDLCGIVHVQKNATGHYTNSTPPDWLLLRMDSNGKRFSYPAEPMRKLLCTSCGERTLQAIERVEPEIKP